MDLLREVVPGLTRVGALVEADNAALVISFEEFQKSARANGMQVQRVDLRSTEDLELAFETLVANRAEALVSLATPLLQ